MDLDDDSLDDLLRDTSANKFKKPDSNVVPEDLLANPQSNSRKEKKSALLAELFGPSSTTSFNAIESSFEDQDRAADKNGSTSNLSTILSTEGKKAGDFKFGSYVPSAAKSSLFGQPSRPASSGSLPHQTNNNVVQPPVFSFEKITAEKNNFTSDNFLNEGSPKQLSSFKIESTVTSSPVRIQAPLQTPTLPEIKPNTGGSSNTHNPNSAYTTAQEGGAKISGNQTEIPASRTIPFTFQLPNSPASKEPQSETNLAIIKEVLENFSNNFCNRLETLTKKNEGLNEITDCLAELHKCINTASQNWLTTIHTAPDRSGNGEFEKKILILESRIESISHENSNLRKQLEFVENQLRENLSETAKIKLVTESVVENNLKWMKEALSNLETKVSSHFSSQSNKQAVEEANSNMLRLTQEKVTELENKLVKSSTPGQQEETLHLLKAEIKWLERQKGKLKSDRKELQVLEKQVQGKLKLLDGLSTVWRSIK